MPLVTRVGQDLESAHIPLAKANRFIREGIAKLMQVLVLLGLVYVALRGAASGLVVTQEFFLLAVASLAVIVAQVLVPNLSVDYGLLRAFQQALFVLAPFLAIGSVALFRPLGRLAPSLARAGPPLAATLAVGAFVSTSGLLPQLTGGYPPQLNLNNAGNYYDLYYVTPNEVAGIEWTLGHVPPGEAEGNILADTYTSGRVEAYTGVSDLGDIVPPLVRRYSYVFLGNASVRSGTSSASIDGDVVTYRYPRQFLTGVKALVYSNGGSEVFR